MKTSHAEKLYLLAIKRAEDAWGQRALAALGSDLRSAVIAKEFLGLLAQQDEDTVSGPQMVELATYAAAALARR